MTRMLFDGLIVLVVALAATFGAWKDFARLAAAVIAPILGYAAGWPLSADFLSKRASVKKARSRSVPYLFPRPTIAGAFEAAPRPALLPYPFLVQAPRLNVLSSTMCWRAPDASASMTA